MCERRTRAEFIDLACAKISEAQKLMSEARELLKKDLDNVRQEKTAFEELTLRRILSQVHFKSTVKLNVGGKIYKTTLDTLRNDPDSMLCAMFSGRHELKADEEDGSYFIDRNGELFGYILDYLRNGELLCPDDKIVQKRLLKEAEFFQVQGIITLLEEKTSLSAIIKNKNHHSTVMSWLPPGATCSLLYRATSDGKSPADFHRCCDNKGPTLLVIRSGEYIFGGYTSKSWKTTESDDSFVSDSQSFLFTLVNPSGSEPTKIAQDGSAGIWSERNWGPTFSAGSRLALCVRCEESCGRLNLRSGFLCPPNANPNTYFAGKSPFEISEMDVFKVHF